jgi:hypothetical protein
LPTATPKPASPMSEVLPEVAADLILRVEDLKVHFPVT